jgi:hypothetical protein
MMVRERTLVIRKAAIRVRVGLRRFDTHRSRWILMSIMQCGEQFIAKVPNEYEQ